MKKVRAKTQAWLKAARLQFYPMAWIAYTLGALSSASLWGKFEMAPYLAGYLFLFFLELPTVFLNDYFDYETDQLNLNGSLFSGGSRAIVDGELSFAEMRMGIFSVIALSAPAHLFRGFPKKPTSYDRRPGGNLLGPHQRKNHIDRKRHQVSVIQVMRFAEDLRVFGYAGLFDEVWVVRFAFLF